MIIVTPGLGWPPCSYNDCRKTYEEHGIIARK
jgi:hypothetical protein